MIPKFRAWDKETKTMIDVSLINFEEHSILGGYWEFGQTESIKFDEIELMQSTGLKDKNGKEIFEGDILAVEADDGVIILKVSWDDEHALFVIKTKKFNEEAALAELVDDNSYPFEVIGNIYENHELLEDSK
jgi:hypothetical protein